MIDIIMASYNGEEYISSQIDSIRNQSFSNWRLKIYDDCSNDKTIEIINRYISLDKRISLVKNDINLGCALTFMKGILESKASYIMLCDQDDIWLENKIKLMYEEITLCNSLLPSLVLAKGIAYNQVNSRMNGRININEPKKLEDFLLLNGGLQGCSMILNRKLADIVPLYLSNIVMHDHYISLLAFTFGEVFYLNKDLMIYRRHEKTVTVSHHGSIFNKLKNIFIDTKFFLELNHFEAVKYFYEKSQDDMSAPKRNIFINFLKLSHSNIFKSFYIITNKKFKLKGSIILAILMILFKNRMSYSTKSSLHAWNSSIVNLDRQ